MTDTVLVGSAPNDGSGDPLRLAFQKVNTKFEAILAAFNYKGDWATATVYSATARDYVKQGGLYYLATTNHTSGTFATDLGAARWVQVDLLALYAQIAGTGAGQGAESFGYLQGAGAIASNGKKQFDARTLVANWGVNTVPGTTDLSAALQACINNNKGKRIVIHEPILVAGILLSGSTYDGTEIVCEGAGELVLKADGGGSNFDTTIWAGLVVQSCDRVKLDLRCNGNRAAMTNRQSIHCVILAAATNTHIPSLILREIRGDGLYIDRASPLNSGAGASSSNVVVDCLAAFNSADDGRNACSVISVDGLAIGTLYSYQVGAVVEGGLMPGGFDVEPNWPAQIAKNITVGQLHVTTFGSAGLQCQGQPATSDAARDWNVQDVVVGTCMVTNTNPSGLPLIRRARDITAKVEQRRIGARGLAASYIDYADRIDYDLKAHSVIDGIYLGYQDFVQDSHIKVNVNDYSSSGVFSIGLKRTKVSGRVSGAANAVSAFPIRLSNNARAGLTQIAAIYEVDLPFDGVNVIGFYNTPGSFVAFDATSCAKNCDWSGYATAGAAYNDNPASPLQKFNIRGVTDMIVNVASTAALTLPVGHETFFLTGNDTITSISATGWKGRSVRLLTQANPIVTDVGNLRLAGNFNSVANSSMVLFCDGTNWIEQSRSLN